jgi:signal transduction histidine kinase/ActR/RegA family two-component response regulator
MVYPKQGSAYPQLADESRVARGAKDSLKDFSEVMGSNQSTDPQSEKPTQLPANAERQKRDQSARLAATDRREADSALKRAHDELEARVRERTAELAQKNRQLQIEIAERRRVESERSLLFAREKAAREQAEAANRLKDEFLATLSHEMRTPLTAILGWACLLRSPEIDEQGFERAREAIERNALAQTKIIDSLLDVSRIIAGKLRLKVQPVALSRVIEDALDTVRPAAQAKEIQIEARLRATSPLVAGDPDRLQQTVWNVLSNAVKFTPRGGRVEVSLAEVKSEATITVSDTGAGIAPEFLEYVFDRFRQADGSYTRAYGGLGLGLAIARHLTELHGGNIEVASEGVGRGATFVIRLPVSRIREHDGDLKSARRSQRSNGSHPRAARPLEGVRVLVVDDEPDNLEMLDRLFKNSGAEVATASSARDALQVLQRADIEVLIADIQMPEEDGYELIRKVRLLMLEQRRQLTAVALTAHAGKRDRIRALEAGYEAHIPKPVEPAPLVGLIARLVRERERGQKSRR